MVDYQEWTRIGFDVARSKGLTFEGPSGPKTRQGGRSFTGREPQAHLTSLLGEIWQERKAELRSATEREAEAIAENEISVS